MKTMTMALLSVLIAAAGCSHDKKPTTPKVTETTTTTTTKVEKPAVTPDKVATDEQVSPGLAISSDILAACGIKAAAPQGSPKFDFDKDELTADDRAVLDKVATCLTSGPLKGKAVSLIGRADPRGTDEYNMGLGSRRSHSVSQYLGRLGVADAQMGVTTRGSLDATGTDESTYREDRRVDIQLQAAATPEG
ncbi:MAG TPA: OmpA family protein [Kofleriaceae bacterium]|jgi:peptidoglycan-associated lipoprotein